MQCLQIFLNKKTGKIDLINYINIALIIIVPIFPSTEWWPKIMRVSSSTCRPSAAWCTSSMCPTGSERRLVTGWQVTGLLLFAFCGFLLQPFFKTIFVVYNLTGIILNAIFVVYNLLFNVLLMLKKTNARRR